MSVSTADIERLNSEIKSLEQQIVRKEAEIETAKKGFETKKAELERAEQSATATLDRNLAELATKKTAAEQKRAAATTEFSRVTATAKK